MRKLLPAGLLVLAVALALAPRSPAEMSEAEKRALFLKAREDIRVVPKASPTPRPKPAPASTPRPTPRATPASKAPPPPTPASASTPRPTPKATPAPRATPTPRPKATPPPKATPRPTPTPKPKATPKPESKPQTDAPIVIEKSGKSKDQGFVPPPKKKGWSLFGGGPKYKYLTPAVRAAIDNAKIKKGRWKYIIVHNSGTRQGNAKAFDNYHKKVRKMPNGLAYHFVIGNGSSSGNGEIEIGNRWVRQINGGHVASDYLNNIAIGICFVGDFNRDLPSQAQSEALKELIDYLRRRCGRTSEGKNISVKGHRQINPKPTDCPGNRFPLKWLNSTFKD